MVNERARQRLRRRGAVGVVPILSALGAERALVGRLITSADLSAWPPPPLTLRDPAVALKLDDLADQYIGQPLTAAAATMTASSRVSTRQLRDLAEAAGRDLGTWQGRLHAAGSMTAADLVATIQSGIGRHG